jgi:hypothetical protein
MNTTTVSKARKAKPSKGPLPVRTPTITLFVPQIIWLQELLNRKAQSMDKSLSTYLMGLIVEDLTRRDKFSATERDIWEKQPCKQTRDTKRGIHTKFTLYVPPALNFIKKRIKQITPVQSTYVWSLFVISMEGQVSQTQLGEWHAYCTTPQRGSASRERKARILKKKLAKV